MRSEPLYKTRIISVDFFRGLTVAFMLLVNNPGEWGHIYSFLRHAPWHGILGADFVFPFFLFLVGVSVRIALGKKGNSFSTYRKILWRSILLFLCGLFLNGFWQFDFASIRIPGVLQRIAFVYCIVACFYLRFSLRSLMLCLISIIIAYWLVLTFLPVPGTNYTGYEVNKNYSAYADRLFLSGHMWKYTKTYDPEGILSSFSALASGFLGVWFAELLLYRRKSGMTLSFFCCIQIIIALLWSYSYPINKNLWTGSYILWNSGIAGLILCFFHKKLPEILVYRLSPILYLGKHALIVFFISSLFAKLMTTIKFSCSGKLQVLKSCIYKEYFRANINTPELASMLYGVCYLLVWTGVIFVYARIHERKVIQNNI